MSSRPAILLIDNYDSFVYNLARYLDELGCQTEVVRNDRLAIGDVVAFAPAAMVISPGPCTPREAGVSCELIRQFGATVPILGVCLGHQAIADALGGKVIRAPEPVHGKASLVFHHEQGVFNAIPNPFRATRYHSLIVDEVSLPADLNVVARTADRVPMALEHRKWPLFGVQFHPESILTQGGHRILSNFLRIAGVSPGELPVGDWTAVETGETAGGSELLRDQPLHW